MYSGQLAGAFSSSLLGDILSARMMMIGGLCFAFIGTMLIALSSVLELCVVGMFLLVSGIMLAVNLTYIFVTEMVQENKRQTYKIMISSAFSCGALVNVLWFFLVPNFEIVLPCFFGVPVFFINVSFILFFKDTPISLITKNSA
jgi:MFS family permease